MRFGKIGYICIIMLTQKEIDIIIETMMPFNPTKIGIFGSFARSENREDSDVDILYAFDSRYSIFDLVRLKESLEKQVKREVDLVEYSAIHPLLRQRILNDQKTVYERN